MRWLVAYLMCVAYGVLKWRLNVRRQNRMLSAVNRQRAEGRGA